MKVNYRNKAIIDELTSIPISLLGKNGYFKSESKTGLITITGGVNFRIAVLVKNKIPHPFVAFTYYYNGSILTTKVNIETTPSNLGVGVTYYFVCAISNKRCRKLYFHNGMLVHRELIKGVYKSQMYSKNDREIIRFVNNYYLDDEVYKEIYQKHFKTHYSGKPTKRYLKLIEKLNKLGLSLSL